MIYLENIISAKRLACSEGMYDPDAAQDAEDELRRLSPMEAELADEKLHVKQLERGLDKALAVNKVLVGALKKTRLLILVSDFRDIQQAQLKEVLHESKEALKLAGESV
jgi:hypothetical protein